MIQVLNFVSLIKFPLKYENDNMPIRMGLCKTDPVKLTSFHDFYGTLLQPSTSVIEVPLSTIMVMVLKY